MKNTFNIITLFLSFCCIANCCHAYKLDSTQSTIKLVRSIKIPLPNRVSIDIYENLYAADFRGNIVKFDSAGRLLFQYSPVRKGEVSALEAKRNVNIFLFNKNLQEYYFLDRFLARSNDSKFSLEIGFARAATISADNNIWVIDDVDFSLKKYEINSQTNILKTPLDLLLNPKFYQINYLIEYHNLLFINDENSGVLIFDNLGNFKNRIDLKAVEYFNFIGDNLYYLKDDTLMFFNIYESRIIKSIPLPKLNHKFALCGENKLYLFAEDWLYIYAIQ